MFIQINVGFLMEWWDWLIERDYTTLATRAENRDEKNFKHLITYKIPLDLNLFLGKRVGFKYGTSEREFLIKLASENNLIYEKNNIVLIEASSE